MRRRASDFNFADDLDQILSVDPKRPMGDVSRSRKLVLFITDGTDRPLIPDYAAIKGVLEDVDPVVVQPRNLPSNVLGYNGVDAIVWLDADANFLISGTHAHGWKRWCSGCRRAVTWSSASRPSRTRSSRSPTCCRWVDW